MKDEALHPSPEDLFAYRDGELPHEKKAIIEAHVMGCSKCRSLIDEVSSLEAEIRRTPEGAPAEYFERLPGAVRGRIASEGLLKEGPVRAARAERRRADDSGRARDGGSVGAAPKLPWAAVLSTASAAAAVVVVVLILVDRGEFRRAVSPLPPPVAMSTLPPPAADSSMPPPVGEIDGAREKEVASDALERAAIPPLADSVAGRVAFDRIAGTKALGKDELVARANEGPERKKDLATRQMAAREAPPTPVSSAENLASMPEKSAAVADHKVATRGDYDSAVRELGLPPVWDDRVSPDALQRAEPRLRLIYQTGRAGADSARVRLYLAEAARLRYAPGDSALFDQIVHHYLRAIRLAGPGSDVARVATGRLQTLER
jgi:hypothetical protein